MLGPLCIEQPVHLAGRGWVDELTKHGTECCHCTDVRVRIGVQRLGGIAPQQVAPPRDLHLAFPRPRGHLHTLTLLLRRPRCRQREGPAPGVARQINHRVVVVVPRLRWAEVRSALS